jgi:plastocyanin
MLKRSLLLAAVAALALFAVACGDDDDDDTSGDDTGGEATTAPADGGGGGEAQTIAIEATDFAFDVTEIEAAPGDEITITLTNSGDAEHTVTIDDPAFEVEAGGGEEAEGSFTAPDATVEFYCRYHPSQMTGTVTISGDASTRDQGGGTLGY